MVFSHNALNVLYFVDNWTNDVFKGIFHWFLRVGTGKFIRQFIHILANGIGPTFQFHAVFANARFRALQFLVLVTLLVKHSWRQMNESCYSLKKKIILFRCKKKNNCCFFIPIHLRLRAFEIFAIAAWQGRIAGNTRPNRFSTLRCSWSVKLSRLSIFHRDLCCHYCHWKNSSQKIYIIIKIVCRIYKTIKKNI